MTDSGQREDAEFLRWVATWLDRIDPILQAVFEKSSAVTDDERIRLRNWLNGTDVQERLRQIADLFSVPPDRKGSR